VASKSSKEAPEAREREEGRTVLTEGRNEVKKGWNNGRKGRRNGRNGRNGKNGRTGRTEGLKDGRTQSPRRKQNERWEARYELRWKEGGGGGGRREKERVL
jgi:hypothetical protein